jgi:hypothetical protein
MSKMSQSNPPQKNRRLFARRPPKRTTKASGHKGALGLGPNVVVSVVDLSETGARLVVKVPLEPRQEVEVELQGQSHPRPLKFPAKVVWSAGAGEGTYTVGVVFERRLSYTELQDLTSR